MDEKMKSEDSSSLQTSVCNCKYVILQAWEPSLAWSLDKRQSTQVKLFNSSTVRLFNSSTS